jgi:hypothetical protein
MASQVHDRRNPEKSDRRHSPRGGRRATDAPNHLEYDREAFERLNKTSRPAKPERSFEHAPGWR